MNLYYPNLTFEDELSGRHNNASPHTQRAVAELAPLMGLLATDADCVVVPDVPNPSDLPDCLRHVRFCCRNDLAGEINNTETRFVPWGWSTHAGDVCVEAGLAANSRPAEDAVWEVNSRRFNSVHDFVVTPHPNSLTFNPHSFGILCGSFTEWSNGVRQLRGYGYDRWVAKTQLSHAGRNRLLGTANELNAQQQGWIRKHIDQPGGIYLEPWVKPTAECGLQFEIMNHYDGDQVRLIGVAELVNDDAGRYRGSLISADDRLQQQWADVIDHGYSVCRAAAAKGYHGPLGIDAFRYALPNGKLATRLCNDINGRFTMGRLALHLRPWLEPGQYGLWTHFVAPQGSPRSVNVEDLVTKQLSDGVSTVDTSPSKIAGKSVRQRTILLIGNTPDQLFEVANILQSR